MQTRDNTNKSPIKLSAVENKLTRWFFYKWGKPARQKPLPGNFKVTTSEIPQLSQQAVTSKGILVPYTNLQLNPYPNTQLDLFCNGNFSFWCTAPNTWLTNCVDPSTRFQSPTREGCWLQSFSVHPWLRSRRCLVTKPYDAQTQQLLHKNDELGQILSLIIICLNKLCSTLMQLVNTLTALKIILLYVSFYMSRVVRKESPNT